MHLTQKCTAALVVLLLSASDLSIASDDGRHSIVLRPKEQSMMLEDMRRYLHGVRKILTAIADQDNQEVEKVARDLGSIAIYEVKPVATDPQVPRFRALATRLHEDFDTLAESAKAGKEPLALLQDLSLLMNQCVKCHETYKTGSYPRY